MRGVGMAMGGLYKVEIFLFWVSIISFPFAVWKIIDLLFVLFNTK
jgi:hypothetical protein